jgi:hypothetical protein
VEELAEEAALDLLIRHALATGSIGVLPVLLKGVEGGHEARASATLAAIAVRAGLGILGRLRHDERDYCSWLILFLMPSAAR